MFFGGGGGFFFILLNFFFFTFAVFLLWAIKHTDLDTVHHYLDDYIFIGSGNTDHCEQLIKSMCREFGKPFNEEKSY